MTNSSTPTTTNLFRAVQLGYCYPGQERPVLKNLGIDMTFGQSVAVLGPSGCGKSTLLRLIAGLVTPTSGKIIFPKNSRPQTSMIFQNYGLLPWKRVLENIALPCKLGHQTQGQDSLAKKLGIKELFQHWPDQLSGGQKQRVAICRALTTTPDLLLLDEPFSALDAISRESLQDTLFELWQVSRFGMILVTHQVEEAVYLGQKIYVMTANGELYKSFDNPLLGRKDLRSDKDFFALCHDLRSALGDVCSSRKPRGARED